MVYYSNEFAEVTPDPEGLVEELITETNQGYINSGIPIRVSLFCVKHLNMSDAYKSKTEILDEFRGMFGNSNTELLNTADSAILLTEKSSGAGAAWYCTACSNNYYYGRTIGFAKKSYALGRFTFAHELGHMFGAHHNVEDADNTASFKYSYGFHFSVDHRSYRTILAYSPGTRVNYYSSDTPHIYHGIKYIPTADIFLFICKLR